MAGKGFASRSERRTKRWKRNYIRQRELQQKINEAAKDILQSQNFRYTREHIQHGNMTVNNHCMNVAKYSLALSRKLRIKCNETELIRGALLHDYFLYDWHDKDHIGIQNLHGFYHPGKALQNAVKEYDLTEREKDIIKKHMWPLTVVPPMYREGWIVTMADKWCSLMETFHVHKGHGAIIEKLRDHRAEESELEIASRAKSRRERIGNNK